MVITQMIRSVTTLEQAIESLDYFNGFHDGFIKSLSVFSQDEFKSIGEQACSGEFTLEIVFAHYNYQQGQRPYNQFIETRFSGVKDLIINFSGNSYEWSIHSVSISEARRTREDGLEEDCLKAVVVQNRLEDGRRWMLHEDISFTFRGSIMREIEAA